MDHSWRPPPLPLVPGNNANICPICSTSHFPFCPPPPFIENPRFHYSQPQNDYYHQRPRFDHPHPFPNHQSSLSYNHDYNSINGHVGRRPTWYGSNPSLDMSPYNAVVDPPMVNGNYSNHHMGGVGSAGYGYDGYDNGGIKRMKIEPIDNNKGPRGSFMGGEIADTSKSSSDNERILKLIHDHGNAVNGGLPKVGANSTSESNGENGNIYAHEKFGETREVRDDMGFKRKREMSDFPSSREDHGVVYAKTNVHFDQRDEQTQDHHRGAAPYHSVLQRSELNQKLHDPATGTLQENHHNLQRTTQIKLPQPTYVNTPSSFGTNFGPVEVPYAYRGQPPLPVSPPPPLPIDPPRNHFFEPFTSPPVQKPSLFPIGVSSSADSLSSSSSSRSAIPEHQSSTQVYYANNAGHHPSTLSSVEEFYTRQSSSEKHLRDVQPFPLQHISSEKPNIIDASRIFKQPHRVSRPDHLVIILRGLPGSGKSYLAKVLRDIEVENGGEAPRIHSMDEYFMTEVEKAEDSEFSKSSGSLRGKRQVMKTVMEYCYEPEMEEAYRASMLKAFKKTLDEGVYSFIIVDDRNLRVADFAQFWATAKRSGYEVYIVEASYKDPAGCAARNVHNFSLDDIQKMATQWEEAPSLYLKMDVKCLLHGDGFDEGGIQEVDMDMEDEDDDAIDGKSPHENMKEQVDDLTPHGIDDDVKKKKQHNDTPEVKHLSRSKWSNDMDGNESHEEEATQNGGALSGLIQAYGYSKEGKSVRWGDQGGNVGFSISATRKGKATTASLLIGPGSGYNSKSNPLSEEDCIKGGVESTSQNVFQERIRAECESFKAVFEKRRHRIGGFNFNVDEE
ncbi:uncharacterized protein LOC111887344 isoform X1 [Lactuca sativa]|uniref:uncharacterized protein LOC111887344 isoform X1 n=1 Tax=Lactuca sativa TaxID=4236 RepID=UPI000CD920CE|nr:uncharacterized protein LOC111887344 isoform X1 [Lactuca sativa]